MSTIYIPTAVLDRVIGRAFDDLGPVTTGYVKRLATFVAQRANVRGMSEDDAVEIASALFASDFPNLSGGMIDGLIRCSVRRAMR